VLQLADKLDGELPISANGNGNDHHRPLSTLEDIERGHILSVLDACEWRIEGPGGAADVLGLNSSTLRSRMNKLGIKRPRPQFSVASASKN